MLLSLHGVRNAISRTASDTLTSEVQFSNQPSNYGPNRLNLFDRSHRSLSKDVKRNRIVAQSSPRVFKHVESCSPCIERTNLSSKTRLIAEAAINEHPTLTTYYLSTLFNSKEKNWRDEHRRSIIKSPSIMGCQKERRGGDMPCEGHDPTPAREGHDHCEERKCKKAHPHSEHEHGVRDCKKSQRDMLDHKPDQHECRNKHRDYKADHDHECKHQHHDRKPDERDYVECGSHKRFDRLREWRGIKDAFSECARRHEAGQVHDEHHEYSECKGKRDQHSQYTPKHGEHEDESGCASPVRPADKGYIIKVSKELMGLFCYIEKQKRSMIKELAHTLRQVACVALVLTCVRGVAAPLVEVFATSPPTWSKLVLMLVSLDSVAIYYLTMKSSEPLEQLAGLATENRSDIMAGVQKEEEMILRIAVELIRLFKRLRNIAISITVSHTAQLLYTVLKLKDPDFVANCTRVVHMWLLAPWT